MGGLGSGRGWGGGRGAFAHVKKVRRGSWEAREGEEGERQVRSLIGTEIERGWGSGEGMEQDGGGGEDKLGVLRLDLVEPTARLQDLNL